MRECEREREREREGERDSWASLRLTVSEGRLGSAGNCVNLWVQSAV